MPSPSWNVEMKVIDEHPLTILLLPVCSPT